MVALTRRQKKELLTFAAPLTPRALRGLVSLSDLVHAEPSDSLSSFIENRAAQYQTFAQANYLIRLEIKQRLLRLLFRSFFFEDPLSDKEVEQLFKRLSTNPAKFGVFGMHTRAEEMYMLESAFILGFIIQALKGINSELNKQKLLGEFKNEFNGFIDQLFSEHLDYGSSLEDFDHWHPINIYRADAEDNAPKLDSLMSVLDLQLSFKKVYDNPLINFYRHMRDIVRKIAKFEEDLFGEVFIKQLKEIFIFEIFLEINLGPYIEEYEMGPMIPTNAPGLLFFVEGIRHFLHMGETKGIPGINNFSFNLDTAPNLILSALQDLNEEYDREHQSLVEPAPATTFIESGSYKWVILDTNKCLHEAGEMGHCGNIGGPLNSRILSLRSVATNQPHLTFIIHFPLPVIDKLYSANGIDLLLVVDLLKTPGWLGEMKGTANNKPKAKYYEHIIKLLEHPMVMAVIGGGYEAEKNFVINDLSPEDLEELKESKPELFDLNALQGTLGEVFPLFVSDYNLVQALQEGRVVPNFSSPLLGPAAQVRALFKPPGMTWAEWYTLGGDARRRIRRRNPDRCKGRTQKGEEMRELKRRVDQRMRDSGWHHPYNLRRNMYRRNARRREQQGFKLRPASKKSLPQQWQDFIRQADNLVKRAKNAQKADLSTLAWDYTGTDVNEGLKNRLLSIAEQVDDLIGKATFCSLPMPHAFYGQPDIIKVFQDAQWRADMCLEAARFITSILEKDPEFDDPSLENPLGYELERIEEHLPPLAKSLPLLYSAAGFYKVNITRLDKIGPIDVYLEEIEGFLPEDIIDAGVKATLKTIGAIYTRYKNLGIPDYALKGPIFIQVGLPPVGHLGVAFTRDNIINVTLLDLNTDRGRDHRGGRSLKKIRESFSDSIFSMAKRDTLFRQGSPAEFTFTLAHELAHRIYFRGLTQRARQSWRDLYDTTILSDNQLLYVKSRLRLLNARFPFQRAVLRNEAREIEGSLTKKEIKSCNYLIKKYEDVKSGDIHKIISKLRTQSQLNRFWPTRYARTNDKEAFADTLASELLPEYWVEKESSDFIGSLVGGPKAHSRYGNTPEASNLIRNILKGVRPHKPRRNPINDAIDGFVRSIEELPLPGQPGEFEQNRRNPMTPDGWVEAFAEIYTPDGIPVWKWDLGKLENIIAPEIQTKEELRELLDNAIDIAVSSGVASPGDKLIVTIGNDVVEIDL